MELTAWLRMATTVVAPILVWLLIYVHMMLRAHPNPEG